MSPIEIYYLDPKKMNYGEKGILLEDRGHSKERKNTKKTDSFICNFATNVLDKKFTSGMYIFYIIS